MAAPRLRSATPAALALAAVLVLGCAAPLGVRPVDPQAVHRRLTGNVLSTGRPSIQTVWVLNRRRAKQGSDAGKGMV